MTYRILMVTTPPFGRTIGWGLEGETRDLRGVVVQALLADQMSLSSLRFGWRVTFSHGKRAVSQGWHGRERERARERDRVTQDPKLCTSHTRGGGGTDFSKIEADMLGEGTIP